MEMAYYGARSTGSKILPYAGQAVNSGNAAPNLALGVVVLDVFHRSA